MVTLYLEAGWEKVADALPFPTFTQPLLYHQLRTLEALRTHDLVLNSYNTGTGKTVASLLYLFDLKGQGKNVLFIAPTNALIGQHTEDIERFVTIHDLDFKVLRVTAADVRALEVQHRPGETLQRLIRNYLEFEKEGHHRQPIILVVNPDIFYYALYFRYGAHDRRNVFQEFLSRFDYIIVDEFHYYDYKQVANFLFAFALFDQLGYFEIRGRKICLLSATPGEAVQQYLNQLFGQRWIHLGPDNEPAGSYGSTPTLTPLELHLESGAIRDWVAAHPTLLADRNQDGAIISSSLAQINEAYQLLRHSLAEMEMGRITGPERLEDRLIATARHLILATPTVDIGYNFDKKGKPCQNIDFVVFDARYGDELLQRLGRAGRVLGKPETSLLSQAVALLSPEAVGALAGLEGRTLSRAEFKQQVTECEVLPPRHNLTAYIRTYAIMESFWPIYQFGKMLPPTLQTEIEALFERVRDLFAPQSRRSQEGLASFFRKVEGRRHWLAQKQMKFNKETAIHVADWLTWLKSGPVEERITLAQVRPKLDYLLADQAQQQALRDFVESQLATTEALFAFRDAFQGPAAVVYDPRHLLSSQTINRYDLFHLLRYYYLSSPLSRRVFAQMSGSTEELAGDFYFQLLDFRESRLQLELLFESGDDREVFERKWTGAPVSLKGVRLQVREQQGDILAGALDDAIITAVAGQALPVLIVPPDSVGSLISRLRGTNLWSYALTVYFDDGTMEEGYRVLLGTAAFIAYAELQGHFLMRERLKPEVIII